MRISSKSSRAVATQKPDRAIVDIRMPPTNTNEGIVAAQRTRELHPGVGVLVLSQYVEPGFAVRLLGENPERSGPNRRVLAVLAFLRSSAAT